MALFGALSIGRSGLAANGAALSVIGNNIANVGTVGFKGSRTEFADLISAEGGGEIGKIGLGTRIGGVRTLHTQGSIEATGRALDLSIQGNGFFVLGDGEGQLFTRAGNLQLDATQAVINLIGKPLLGYPLAPDGTVQGGLTAVTLANATSRGVATTSATIKGNLDAGTAGNATAFDTATPSFANAFAASDFPTSIRVYDSLGAAHDLSVFFKKTGSNTWDVHVGVDAGETGGTAGNLQLIANATIQFNTDGSLAGVTAGSLSGNVTFSGAAAQTIALDLGSAGAFDGMTQYAAPSGIGSVVQDGFGAGDLASVGVDEHGILTAVYDNGQTRALYQLAIAHFNAPEGLEPIGNQLFRATLDSGDPAIGVAGGQGNGTIVASALEQSNVDLAQEFINLISTQRAFQANTRIINASDTMLNDLINTVR
jgi:flagellar hook protein FlgE